MLMTVPTRHQHIGFKSKEKLPRRTIWALPVNSRVPMLRTWSAPMRPAADALFSSEANGSREEKTSVSKARVIRGAGASGKRSRTGAPGYYTKNP